MSTLLREAGERGFIRAIRKNFPMALAGDDGAVLPSLRTPVVTTDSFFEGTHFHRWWTEPDRLAVRLMEATLSDLAAMGAEPEYLFSSVVLPPDIELEWMLSFYRGLTSRKDCPVAGGETIRGNTFGVTLTAMGDCGSLLPFRRSSAEPGDSLWLTGPLGRTLDAPSLLLKGRTGPLSPSEESQVRLFLEPSARFDAVKDLRDAGVRCAIDVSDGLFSECGHISSESHVGIEVELEGVPVVEYCRGRLLAACSAGEDFELLFTAPCDTVLQGCFKIGRVTAGVGLRVLKNGSAVSPDSLGYDHFAD